MKFFGHPLHIMLIHFPTALLPMELVCYFLNYYTGNTSFSEAAFYAMFGAVLSGWMAVIFGIVDLRNVPQDKPVTMKSALLHGIINTTVIIIYTVLVFSAFKNYPQMPVANISILIVKTLLVGFLLAGNYIGGSLILKHRIGIEKNQAND